MGKRLAKAGMKMSSVVPSTMGTLMSSGVMEGGKRLSGCEAIGPAEFASFLEGYAAGIQKRGKCQRGDRTVLDAIGPAADAAAQAAAQPGATLASVAEAAVRGADEGVTATRDMTPSLARLPCSPPAPPAWKIRAPLPASSWCAVWRITFAKGNDSMGKLIGFGDFMVRLGPPGYQRFIQCSQFDVNYTGAEANVCVSLAMMGMETEFVTRLPDNDIARAGLATLRKYGVGVRHVAFGGERMGVFYVEKGASSAPGQGGLRSQVFLHCHRARRGF